MDTPLNASAHTAGSLISGSTFEVPPFQREYSWREEEVREFFQDIQRSLDADSYFLGLIILTDEGGRKKIVDGQQRIVTLTLLASALCHQAQKRGRSALADRLRADFLTSINYETDGNDPRVILTDTVDNQMLQKIIRMEDASQLNADEDSVSSEIIKSYKYISKTLADDLKPDPFKRLGKWTEFITHKLFFAVFIHPTPSEAYRVFEVINTRGRDLTTADLLKNFILSQFSPGTREVVYGRWNVISDCFPSDGSNSFVQYIRHVVTVNSGHILPKDLFSFLASRTEQSRSAPTPLDLMDMLEARLPAYLQMIDPSLAGPADEDALNVFRALSRLGVITVRPIMLAILQTQDANKGLRELLKLITRRIVVGNLGTGNIERRFSEAAKRIADRGEWKSALDELNDLNPDRQNFIDQLKKRSFNKGVISFLKNSIVSRRIAPDNYYFLHFIAPKSLGVHSGFEDGELSYWGGSLGNTFLAREEKRIDSGATWIDFKHHMLQLAAPGEAVVELKTFEEWTANSIKSMGELLADRAAEIWYA